VKLYLHKPSLTRVRGRKHSFPHTAVPVYYLASRKETLRVLNDTLDDENHLTAYFCPYEDNRTLGVVVAKAANLMFTTEMDGCTFAVGSQVAGDRLVYHSNQKTAGEQASGAARAGGPRRPRRSAPGKRRE
jgi:hypothetical protein